GRVRKIVDIDGAGIGPAATTRFALDKWNNTKPTPIGTENTDVWADLDGSSSLQSRYFRGDFVDQILGRIEGSDRFWHLADNLGSVRDVITSGGVESIDYDAWGNILQDDTSRGRYGWTGRELDAESELQYNRARYYDSVTGRWISQDPMGFDAGDSNLYRHVNNRPTNAVDPSGLQEGVPYETGPKNAPPAGVKFVSGPTVDVVSWIQKTDKSEWLMNRVANPEPPLRFEPAKLQPAGNAQPKQWGDFLNEKQFRDHLFVKMTVYGKNDSITAYTISASQNLGYTPPALPGAPFVQGVGDVTYNVTEKTQKRVSVEVKARFVVHPVENLGQAIINRRSPWGFAWVSLTYTMSIGKNGGVDFSLSNLKGTLVPSHYFYVNGELVAKYNMDNKNAEKNIDGFINMFHPDKVKGVPLKDFNGPGVTYSGDIEGFTDLTKKK
ncbi:MAG: RHS repeat-associated core domain-containing protein, partial [Gemmataceae bacterium]|nr:RHS repeat-associated core domain-containing protein [Gemmataceae bacterium]